jgi:UDP-3-O-[3-hydroxymyristoyl] glucosamine N-acyltransferase
MVLNPPSAEEPSMVPADDRPPFVHPTAVVEDGAELGAGCQVWHHAHVREGARLGRGCVLGKNVFVDAGVRIGTGCHVQNNVSVYAGVELEDDVFVGPAAVFTNDRVPRAGSARWELARTLVRAGASIGANATLVAGIVIDTYAMVGAGAVVTHDVAAYQLVLGTPARPAGWVCRCGAVVTRDVTATSLHCTTCALDCRLPPG